MEPSSEPDCQAGICLSSMPENALFAQWQRPSTVENIINRLRYGLFSPHEISVVASIATEPDILKLIVESPYASADALSEIASHPSNCFCWDILAKHPNATALHLEMLLNHTSADTYVDIQCSVAQSSHITREIVETLLLNNSTTPPFILRHIKNKDRRKVLEYLSSNKFICDDDRRRCLEQLNGETVVALTAFQKAS